MKILITSDWYAPIVNGVVASILNLKSEMEKRGHEVRVLTLSPTIHTYEEDGVYYIASIDLGVVYPNARLRRTKANPCIRDIIEWHPDVVHSQCEFSTYHLASKIAKELNIPFIHTYHTVYENYTHYFSPSRRFGRFAVARFSRRLLNHTDCVVAPSRKVGRLLKSYGVSTPICIIPTGIDLDKFASVPDRKWLQSRREEYGIGEDTLTMVYIGRLAREKNLEEIISFLPDLRGRDIRLIIVGDGPNRHEVEKAVVSCEVADLVTFTGMIPASEVGSYYHLGDVFVNASTSETQGLTYFEALSAGLPLLCRKDPCLEDVVIDGEDGWQYSNREEFTTAVDKLLADCDLRSQMSRKAWQKSIEFSTTVFATNIEKLYNRMISGDYDNRKTHRARKLLKKNGPKHKLQ